MNIVISVWRGPELEGHYQNGDIVEYFPEGYVPGGAMVTSGCFEFVTVNVDETKNPVRTLSRPDTKEVHHFVPDGVVRAGLLHRYERVMEEAIENKKENVERKRRMYWDGVKIRSKRHAA